MRFGDLLTVFLSPERDGGTRWSIPGAGEAQHAGHVLRVFPQTADGAFKDGDGWVGGHNHLYLGAL